MIKANGTYTLVSKKTGNHITVEIKTVLPTSSWRQGRGRRILKIRAGSSLVNVGFLGENGLYSLDRDGNEVAGPFRKFTNEHSGLVKPALYAVKVLAEGQTDTPECEVEESQTCRVCNRTLTNPESIQTGIGPECARKGY